MNNTRLDIMIWAPLNPNLSCDLSSFKNKLLIQICQITHSMGGHGTINTLDYSAK
jgi:hypothetical protein